jgi:hypothetical protein
MSQKTPSHADSIQVEPVTLLCYERPLHCPQYPETYSRTHEKAHLLVDISTKGCGDMPKVPTKI